MVIIRVGMANKAADNPTSKITIDYTTSSRQSFSVDRRNKMEVHVMTLTESKVENGIRSPMNPIGRENRWSQIKMDGVTLEV